MRAVVADASALVDYLLSARDAAAIAAVVEHPDTDVHVPALCDVEVAAAMRRALIEQRLPVDRAEEVVEDYLDLPLVRHGHESLLAPILRRRANFTAYDAAYVTLAEELSAEVLSSDRRLLRAIATHTQVPSALARPTRLAREDDRP